MLTIIVGENPGRSEAVKKLIDAEIKKGKQLAAHSDASWHKETVMSYASGADMFGAQYVVHLSRIAEHPSGLEFFTNDARVLSESETLYIAEESELSKELQKIFEDAGAKVSEIKSAAGKFGTGGQGSKSFFGGLNSFQLVDAYNLRDKKNAWMLFTKLIEAGTSAEEIAGAMIWNFKNLALYFSIAESPTSKSKPSAESLGLKPFVFSKVAAAAKNFSGQEIATKSYQLSSALHRSHRGQGDGATLLELFILKSL